MTSYSTSDMQRLVGLADILLQSILVSIIGLLILLKKGSF